MWMLPLSRIPSPWCQPTPGTHLTLALSHTLSLRGKQPSQSGGNVKWFLSANCDPEMLCSAVCNFPLTIPYFVAMAERTCYPALRLIASLHPPTQPSPSYQTPSASTPLSLGLWPHGLYTSFLLLFTVQVVITARSFRRHFHPKGSTGGIWTCNFLIWRRQKRCCLCRQKSCCLCRQKSCCLYRESSFMKGRKNLYFSVSIHLAQRGLCYCVSWALCLLLSLTSLGDGLGLGDGLPFSAPHIWPVSRPRTQG